MNNGLKTSILLLICMVISNKLLGQVGINTTSPTATLHVFGTTTLPVAGSPVTLLSQNFNSAYSVTHSSHTQSGCASPATVSGWERTTTGASNINCTSCGGGGWLWINSDESGCSLNSTARIDFTTAPTSTTVTIAFDYRYNNYSTSGDSFRAFLWNNTTNAIVGANLVGLLTADANTSFSGTRTVVAGNSYSLRFEYIGDFDYGASVDNIVVTETGAPTPGVYTFRLQDGQQAAGRVMTSDANGNATWAVASGGGADQTLSISGNNLTISGAGGNTVALPAGTDSQTLSISGNTLSISGGNSVTLPSGSSSNTYTNGLTLTGTTVRLGGTLTQDTTLNLDDDDLIFRSSTTAAFPGEIKIEGTDRVMMETRFDDNYVSFGGGFVLIDSDDGLTFTDSGGDTYTRDFSLGFYNGSSGGSSFAMGSIEYAVDGLNELLFECSSINPLADNSTRLGGSSKRWTAVWAVNGTIQTSDMNLKKNVVPLQYGLNEILKLNTYTYKWKNQTLGKTQIPEDLQETKIGFSAQQLFDVLPNVVQTHSWVPANEEGDFKHIKNENLGVAYSDIIPVVVKAIQEQQTQIEELKKQNAILLALLNKK
jgi:hypothetical protein